MDSQDVCLLLNVSKRTLQTYRDRKLLPYTSIGGKFFYRESDVAEYLESKTVKSK
ncbi:MAG: helix-turn-helix domain-containing protein [Alistipes ihumii]|uniref:helix-turn-helix domain-containing protein n=1 Tax=Parabacteroides sp. TaxID=1869337 RepID=UPI00283FB42C|nr:helix-turn-helix domain-containing protein [Parabacteroides sp.]MDR3858039.1 helix-turn-helix domain-containing protein [Parabacteroides sp.]